MIQIAIAITITFSAVAFSQDRPAPQEAPVIELPEPVIEEVIEIEPIVEEVIEINEPEVDVTPGLVEEEVADVTPGLEEEVAEVKEEPQPAEKPVVVVTPAEPVEKVEVSKVEPEVKPEPEQTKEVETPEV